MIKAPSKENIKNDVQKFSEALKEENYSISFCFEYSKNGKAQMAEFNYAKATTDEATEKSLMQRFIKTFSQQTIKDKELQEFDVLKNDKSCIYFLRKNAFNNSKLLIDHLENDVPAEDLSVLKKLQTVRGIIVKVEISDEIYYLFFNVNTFNAFKKVSIANGFVATLTDNGVKRIDDYHTLFGMKDKLAFYFHNGYYYIDSEAHSVFEKMLFLSEEYTKKAESTVKVINDNLKDVFPNVSELGSSLKEKKSSGILARMVARIPIDSIEKEFNKNQRHKTFERIKNIIKDPEFKGKLDKLTIDYDKLQIRYTEKGKFAFAALLSGHCQFFCVNKSFR